MKKISLMLFVLVVMSSCTPKKTAVSEKLVITGIAPIARLTERIAGDAYTVRFVIPTGTSPHDFALRPTDAAALEKASAVIAVHPSIDGAILHGASTEHILMASKEDMDRGGHAGHNHGKNFHYWLSLTYSKDLAFKIAAILTQLDPSQGAEFQKNAQIFAGEVDELGLELKKQMGGKNISALQQHPAWDFFFEELGIKNLGSVEQFEGDQISPSRMVEAIKLIRAQKNPALVDDAFTAPSPILTALKNETKARYLSLNPMFSEEDKKDDIPSILRSAAKGLLGE